MPKETSYRRPDRNSLLVAAERADLNVQAEHAKYKKMFEHPFDAATKRMITVSEGEDGKQFAAMKGAPSVMLDVCDKYVAKDGTIKNSTKKTAALF